MKLTVKEKAGCAEKVIIECDTKESLYINHAMRSCADSEESEEVRVQLRKMLEVKPVFEEEDE